MPKRSSNPCLPAWCCATKCSPPSRPNRRPTQKSRPPVWNWPRLGPRTHPRTIVSPGRWFATPASPTATTGAAFALPRPLAGSPLKTALASRSWRWPRYRCGLMTEALATLTRSNDLNKQQQPSDLAFLALAQHRLGQSEKARSNSVRLREVMKKRSNDPDDEAFLREAELIELGPGVPREPICTVTRLSCGSAKRNPRLNSLAVARLVSLSPRRGRNNTARGNAPGSCVPFNSEVMKGRDNLAFRVSNGAPNRKPWPVRWRASTGHICFDVAISGTSPWVTEYQRNISPERPAQGRVLAMSQSLVNNLIHLVYSTKNRQPWIRKDIRPGLFAYQSGIYQEWDSPAIVIGGVDDHVHAIFSLSKNHPLKKIVEEVKKGSSKWMKVEGSLNPDFHWQAGYAGFSVSHSNVPAVKRTSRTRKPSPEDDISRRT